MTARPRSLFFSLVFCLTGVGTALMGATLPAILHQWHLSDGRGGFLLLATWGGSTSGAFFAGGKTGRIAAIGLALSALGMFVLVLVGPPLLPLLYALYGLGLGITMTSISMMRAREVETAAADVELNRLNLLWALGAFFAPAVALHSLRMLSVSTIFRVLGTLLGLASLLALVFSAPGTRPGRSASAADSGTTTSLQTWAPIHLCLFAAAAVGLESAIGSWLTTYAERSTLGVVTAVSANSAFWAGLLISRALHSIPSAIRFRTRGGRATHIAAAGLALLLLLLFPTRTLLPLSGLLCGLGLGPLYPWVLSVALPRFRSTAVFVLAGVGASVTPWLTGTLSSVSGSLRIGLLAPAGTFVLLAAVAVRIHTTQTQYS